MRCRHRFHVPRRALWRLEEIAYNTAQHSEFEGVKEEGCEYGVVWATDGEESYRANFIFNPSQRRMGIAWKGKIYWAECDLIEEGALIWVYYPECLQPRHKRRRSEHGGYTEEEKHSERWKRIV